jgi:hypothetical protein
MLAQLWVMAEKMEARVKRVFRFGTVRVSFVRTFPGASTNREKSMLTGHWCYIMDRSVVKFIPETTALCLT